VREGRRGESRRSIARRIFGQLDPNFSIVRLRAYLPDALLVIVCDPFSFWYWACSRSSSMSLRFSIM
jgi:hypothetical protein